MRSSRSTETLLPFRSKKPEKTFQVINKTDKTDKLINELTISKHKVARLEKRIGELEIDLMKERAINEDLSMRLKKQETVELQHQRLRKEKERTLSMEKSARQQIQADHSSEVQRLKGQVNYYKSRLLAKNASANIALKENPKLRRQVAELRDQILWDVNKRR